MSEKQVEQVKKVRKPRTVKDPNKPKRETSMTTQKIPITDNLCDFFEMPHGSKLTKSEVTQKFWKHVKDNGLSQSNITADNKKQIIITCDAKLKKLFEIPDNQSFKDKFGEDLVFSNVTKHFKQFYLPIPEEDKLPKKTPVKKTIKKDTEKIETISTPVTQNNDLTNEEKPPKKAVTRKKTGGEKVENALTEETKDDKNNEITLKKTVCKFFELPEKSKMNNLDFFNNHLKKHIIEQSNGEYKFDEKFSKLLKLDDRKYNMSEINQMIQ